KMEAQTRRAGLLRTEEPKVLDRRWTRLRLKWALMRVGLQCSADHGLWCDFLRQERRSVCRSSHWCRALPDPPEQNHLEYSPAPRDRHAVLLLAWRRLHVREVVSCSRRPR